MVGKEGRNVVVTGGAGFIGSHAAEFYARKGWNVTVLDNLSRPPVHGFGVNTKVYNWNYLKGLKNIRLVRGSVLQQRTVDELISDADAVIHTAAQVAVTTSLDDPAHDFNTNVRGTFNVLEACRKSGKEPRVVFCSTNKVYGENVNSIPVRSSGLRYYFSDEDYSRGIPEDFSVDACKHSPYGSSKLSADIYVQEYGKTYGLRTACCRMSCIYGDRQFGSEDQGWVAHFVISALLGRKLTIYGDGKQVRDVLHVDDLVRAYDCFIESNLPSGVFNLGGGWRNTTSLLELVRLLEGRLKRRIEPAYGEWRNSDQKVYISDIGRARRKLKWKPEIGVREGVERLLDWASKTLGPAV